MKRTKLKSAATALALAAALATSAQANVTDNVGDLILGFQLQGGSTNDYEVDLGSATNFLDVSGTLTFNLSTADLTSAFGSSWADNTNVGGLVQWGVVGASSRTADSIVNGISLPQSTLFYTQGEQVGGVLSTAPAAGFTSGQTSIAGAIFAFDKGTGGFNGSTASPGSATGLSATLKGSSVTNGWTQQLAADADFGIGSGIEQPATGNNTGPTNSVLDLYELQATDADTGTPGTSLLGSFQLGANGVLTFTGAPEAVPEPSSYLMMLLGIPMLAFLVFRRRTTEA